MKIGSFTRRDFLHHLSVELGVSSFKILDSGRSFHCLRCFSDNCIYCISILYSGLGCFSFWSRMLFIDFLIFYHYNQQISHSSCFSNREFVGLVNFINTDSIENYVLIITTFRRVVFLAYFSCMHYNNKMQIHLNVAWGRKFGLAAKCAMCILNKHCTQN